MNYNSYYLGKKILITGGYGFIGSNLTLKLLDLGALVHVIDNMSEDYGANLFNLPEKHENLSFSKIDTRDKKGIAEEIKGQDIIFNLAGQLSHVGSMEDPWNDLSINVEAQINILESCRKHNSNVRILFAGTRQIYGKPHYLPVDEKHPISPVDVNGINKFAAENYHLLYHNVYGLNSTILRITNTYGPRMRIKDAKQTFIGIWLRSILENKPITIYGDGSQIRDLTFVDDLVHAMLLAAQSENAFGDIFNIGGEKVTLMEIVKTLKIIRPNCCFEFLPFPEERKVIDIGNYFADDSKIKYNLGWQRATSLQEGLQRSLDYYEKYSQYYLEG